MPRRQRFSSERRPTKQNARLLDRQRVRWRTHAPRHIQRRRSQHELVHAVRRAVRREVLEAPHLPDRHPESGISRKCRKPPLSGPGGHASSAGLSAAIAAICRSHRYSAISSSGPIPGKRRCVIASPAISVFCAGVASFKYQSSHPVRMIRISPVERSHPAPSRSPRHVSAITVAVAQSSGVPALLDTAPRPAARPAPRFLFR